MTTLELKLSLPDEVLTYLQQESNRRNVSINEVVAEVIADYFDEPTQQEILEDIRLAMNDVRAGRLQAVDDFITELKQELAIDDDAS